MKCFGDNYKNIKFLLALFVYFQLVFHPVNADIPVHCLSSSIEGVWILHLSNNNGESSIKCGHEHPDQNLDHISALPEKNFQEKYQTIVRLERPNHILSMNPSDGENLEIGTWTMIYDEGFSMKIKDYNFFAFSGYEQIGKFTPKNTDTEDTEGYRSVCNKTFLGWYNNNSLKNWGCYWAEKVEVNELPRYNLNTLKYDNLFNLKQVPMKGDSKKNNQKQLSPGEDTGASMRRAQHKYDDDHAINYTDFLKNLLQASGEEDDSMSNIPHLDIYFMNDIKDDQTQFNQSNFLEESASVILKEKVFEPDSEYVNKINNPESDYLWEATIYPQFVGKSYSSMRSLLGNTSKLKLATSAPPPEEVANQFIELEVDVGESQKNKATLELPLKFSWTDVDGVNYDSPLKKQGECGSCYAISMVSIMEARIRIKTNNRLKPILSPSSVIGCSRYNQGCSGGYPYLVGKHGFEFGFVEESCQPYQENDNTCKNFCFEDKVYKVLNYGYVGDYDGACNEEKMMEEIYKNGPIVVAINATPELYYYKSGIFHSKAMKKEGIPEKGVRSWEYTNHAVVAVGWGEEVVKDTVEKFWILKNSWGEEWGEKGYFRLLRGTDMASVEAQAVYLNPDI